MRAVPLTLALLVACGQDVVAPPCVHPDASADADALAPADAGALDAQADAGALDASDAGTLDALPPDAGDPRCPGPYCLTALVASSTRANVRELVTLTPVVDNPGGAVLSYGVRPAELTTTRRPGRPPLVLSQIELQLEVDSTTGVASFRVANVPPWFIATTFHLRVYVSAAGGPESFAEVDITVRGNTLISGHYSDVSRVYAVASDGRPAQAPMPGLNSGELITQLARYPSALLLSRDGSLIVHDAGASPPRLMRFELTGHDQQLSAFDHQDAQGTAYLDRDPTYPYSIVELGDGRVAVADYDFSRNPKSRVVMWNADGSYRATYSSADPQAVWTGIGAANGELLLTRLDGGGRVERVDPNTGALLGTFVDGLPGSARGVLGRPDGVVYVSGDGYVLRVEGRQRSIVNMIPTGTGTLWRVIAPWTDGRILTAEESRSDVNSPILIHDRMFERRLRSAGAGNIATTIRGIAHLE